MRRCRLFKLFTKKMPTARVFFLVTCTLTVSLIFTQLITSPDQLSDNESLLQEALENVAKDPRYSEIYRKTSRLRKDLKYILLWTAHDYAPLYYFELGQRGFIKNNCSVINCYVTTDRSFFDGDITKFDAIAFNGRNMKPLERPSHRSVHQKYIFINMESADNYPICSNAFDGFFNWTSTYKLNSDIPYTYILIKNNKGEIVGPKTEMHWTNTLPVVEDQLTERLANKSKAAAWFVSHCSSRSGRKDLVKKLQKVLGAYGYTVDIYGSCGPLTCPRNKKNTCNSLLEREYFFYMSLENSFAEDYVTEKLLTALQHNVVPITYGGANYSRFLPPGSYLDAKKMTIPQLAATMDRLMNSPRSYSQYFRWQSRYSYSDPSAVENVCALCAALNNKEMTEKVTEYKEFRRWWNPDYERRCSGS